MGLLYNKIDIVQKPSDLIQDKRKELRAVVKSELEWRVLAFFLEIWYILLVSQR